MKTTKTYRFLQRHYGNLRQCFLFCRRKIAEGVHCYKYSKMGLNGLDDMLAPYIQKEKGFFIEVGANDGVAQSNTYFLEKALGWQGVLIEAVPCLYKKCLRNRKRSKVFNYALVSPDKNGSMIPILYDGGHGLCTKVGEICKNITKKTIHIKGRTLTSILSEAVVQHIDFFSLDVEGYELFVLNGLDLQKFKPQWILVETAKYDDVFKMLSNHYEYVEKLTHHDYLFKRKSNFGFAHNLRPLPSLSEGEGRNNLLSNAVSDR